MRGSLTLSIFSSLALVAGACGGHDDDSASGSGDSSTGDTGEAPTTGASSGGVTDASTTGAATDGGSGGTTGETTGETTGGTTGVDPVWADFEAQREQLLETLAPPILSCIANKDTNHPVWNGCIDWHSSVHATYALHAIYRHTGDASYLQAAEAKMTPAGLMAELANVQQGAYPQEVPYGYAWFLVLARERERATGATDLVPLATEIAAQLRAYLAGRTPQQFQAGMLADDYLNLSWAIVNLWQWGEWTGDADLMAEMEGLVLEPTVVEAYDGLCPFEQEEADADDFFPPCLHRALALSTMWPQAEAAAWLGTWLPDAPVLTPITMPAAAHIGGLNFSRAWGLYAGYRVTGDPALRDLYLDHLLTHIEQPQYWAEDYFKYAHWVAQFGVYAISQTYEP